jgi:TPR repeat protein
VNQDFTAAVSWFRKAAEQGNATAQNNLGLMLEIGRGVTQDFTAAVSWFRKAAEQGYDTAQINLGRMLDSGDGVTQDFTEAEHKLLRDTCSCIRSNLNAEFKCACCPITPKYLYHASVLNF